MLFTRMRRQLSVLLALLLLPSLTGVGACRAPAGDHASHASTDTMRHGAMDGMVDASTVDGAHDDCCPQPGLPSHCTTAPGCGLALAANAAPPLPSLVTAQHAVTPFDPLARPGPSPAPDVPPPKA